MEFVKKVIELSKAIHIDYAISVTSLISFVAIIIDNTMNMFYKFDASECFGVPKKYFNINIKEIIKEYFEPVLIIIFCVLLIYIFEIIKLHIFSSLIFGLAIFVLLVISTNKILKYYKTKYKNNKWLFSVLVKFLYIITPIVSTIFAILLSYNLLDNSIKIVFTCYFICVLIVFSIIYSLSCYNMLKYKIKNHEFVKDNGKLLIIITEYNNCFIVQDVEFVDENTIKIKKDDYRFIEIKNSVVIEKKNLVLLN